MVKGSFLSPGTWSLDPVQVLIILGVPCLFMREKGRRSTSAIHKEVL